MGVGRAAALQEWTSSKSRLPRQPSSPEVKLCSSGPLSNSEPCPPRMSSKPFLSTVLSCTTLFACDCMAKLVSVASVYKQYYRQGFYDEYESCLSNADGVISNDTVVMYQTHAWEDNWRTCAPHRAAYTEKGTTWYNYITAVQISRNMRQSVLKRSYDS